MKVENLPEARPQWGLDHADIVFEEPVEGGITRFIVLYQCYGAPRIEPVRSARFVDLDILKPLGRILFAYSGAIQPVIDAIDSSPLLDDIGADRAGGAYARDPTRVEPHNLETSTAALYSAAATFGYHPKPPTPYFTYGPLPTGGQHGGRQHRLRPGHDDMVMGRQVTALVPLLLGYRARHAGRQHPAISCQRRDPACP